jgi:cobalt/nickel transport system permease protein
MGGIHAIIGVGEGLITLGALAFIYASRRDLLQESNKPTPNGWAVWGIGLIIALALAIASPMASKHPDGLEWVAKQKGFLDFAQGPGFRILPDYIFPGISNENVATISAGILGTLLVFLIALGIALLRRKRVNHDR